MDEFRRRLLMIQTSEGGGDIEIPTTDGVYILGTDNKFYKIKGWNQTTDKAVGVAIIDPQSNFVIAPELGVKCRWSGQQVLIHGVANASDKNRALKDYAGYENTQKIFEQDSQAEAALACKGYYFKNGMAGYLPSLGELNLVKKYLLEVNQSLQKIGSNPLGASINDSYWSSTQYDRSSAWSMYLADGFAEQAQKNKVALVLACAKL